MNNAIDWQKGNARYLVAAMAWLRACLEQLAAQQREDPGIALPVLPAREGHKSVWRHFLGGPPELPAKTSSLLLPGVGTHAETYNDQYVEQAAAAMQAAAGALDPPPALLLQTPRLGLPQFEHQASHLWLGLSLGPGGAS